MISECRYAEKKKNVWLSIGILFAIICLAYITFPTKIKVSVGYQDEKNKSAYLVQKENILELESMNFYENQFVTILPIEKLSRTDSLMIKYDEMLPGELVGCSAIKMALGNYVFCQTEFGTDSIFGYHDIAFDKEGAQYVNGEVPYVLVYNLGQILENQWILIVVKHICLWLFVWVLTVILAITCKSMLCTFGGDRVQFLRRAFRKFLILCGVIIVGCLLGYIAVIINEKLVIFKELQKAEIYCLFSFLGVIAYFIYKRCGKLSYSCWATVAIGICLFFSISGSITFLTADERTAIREQAKILADPLRHWYMGNAWTNYIILGTFWRIFDWERLEVLLKLDYTQIGKLVHWIAGNILLLYICEIVQRDILNKDNKLTKLQVAVNYIILYMVTLLNPVITMAFKSYNYDLFSMLFGTLGAMCAFIAIRDKKLNMAAKGIVFAFLGGIEKKVAIPIIIIAAVAFVFVVLWRLKGKKYRFLKGYLVAVGTMGIHILLTEIVYRYVCEFLKKGFSHIVTLRDIVNIALSLFSPFHEIVYKNVDGFMASRICFLLLMSGGIFLAATLIDWMCEYGQDEKHDSKIRIIENIMQICIVIFLGIGIIASFLGIDYSEEKFIYFLYILKNYVISIPTILMVLFVFSVAKMWNRRGHFSILLCMLFVTWGVVPCYMLQIRWNPTWTRYLDLFLLLFSLLIVISTVPKIYQYFSKREILGVSVALSMLFHICEIMGSMPGFTYFAPYWYAATSYVNKEKEMGVYWGENKASLGELVLEYCQEQGIDIDSQPIGIRYGYVRGTWQTAPDNVNVYERDWNSDLELCGTTEYDFYAFDTQAIQRKMVDGGWPEGVEPIITVKYRGYVLAKIYQGSQLKEYFMKQWKPMSAEAAL